jgi:hypothetical protein
MQYGGHNCCNCGTCLLENIIVDAHLRGMGAISDCIIYWGKDWKKGSRS